MSDTDVFIISIVQHANPSEAIKEAIADAGINSARVQDVIFGVDESLAINADKILSFFKLDLFSGYRFIEFARAFSPHSPS